MMKRFFAGEPGDILIEVAGVFVALRAEQARELLGRVIDRSRESRAGWRCRPSCRMRLNLRSCPQADTANGW